MTMSEGLKYYRHRGSIPRTHVTQVQSQVLNHSAMEAPHWWSNLELIEGLVGRDASPVVDVIKIFLEEI